MNKAILTLTAIAGIFLVSCNSRSSQQNLKSEKESVSVKEASEMLKNNAIMIDVRGAAEVAELAYDVENIRNIPFDSLEIHLSEIPKDIQVIIVSRTESKSQKAFKFLKSKGFENITVMQDGISAWQEAGFNVIAGDPQERKSCCSKDSSGNCIPVSIKPTIKYN